MMSTISNSSQLNKVQSNFRGDNMVSSILNSNNKQILTIKTNVKQPTPISLFINNKNEIQLHKSNIIPLNKTMPNPYKPPMIYK